MHQTPEQCEAKDQVLPDGMLVSGHFYIAKECILDEEFGRYYFVDECMYCGTVTAGYIDEDAPIAQTIVDMYESQHQVAGIV